MGVAASRRAWITGDTRTNKIPINRTFSGYTRRLRIRIGGREWESNPLRAVWRPSLALKASRPTGNASPPRSIFREKPPRCHLCLRHGAVLLELGRHGAAEIAAAHRDAVAVEELQDQDRDLAAVVELVAGLRGGEVGAQAARRAPHLRPHRPPAILIL